jgi:hypothetical protein
MTFDDDFLQLEFEHGMKRVTCKSAGLDWPPPETLSVFGFHMRRDTFSQISDEQRSGMDHVCRGARYVIDEAAEAKAA